MVLVDAELQPDAPFERDLCGRCTRCLSACPTGALLGRDPSGAPRMDARRCISYLTIELKGAIPRELRPAIGNRIYGCDICQEVCPHNGPKFVRDTAEPEFLARDGLDGPALIEWMAMSQDEFSRRFRGSPIKRAKRRGLLRNVAVALGNWGSVDAVPVLLAALGDAEPLIRGHAAWALGRIGAREKTPAEVAERIASALAQQGAAEPEGWVRDELDRAGSELAGRAMRTEA